MSQNHNGGNILTETTREEHQGALNAKRVIILDGDGNQVTSFGGGEGGGGGVAAYSDSGGTDKKGLVDADRHVQADVLSSALPTGAATSAKQDTAQTALDAIKTATETLDNAVSGSEMQVDVVAALPAGNNNIGDVDIASLPNEGQQTMANSISVAVASNQSAIPVDGSGATQPVSHAALTELAAAIDTEVQVDVVGALPAGDNNIGNVDLASSIPAGTNNIGDVDVLSLPAIPAGNNNIGDVDVATLPVAFNSGTTSATTQRVVLATDVALPAGTNAIGKLAANSGVDIGDVDVTSAVTSTIDHGSNQDVDTAAEQITSTSFACKFGVTLRADAANTGILYIGNSDVTVSGTAATDGIPLHPGDSLFLPVSNSNIPYAIASANNQKIYWIAA